MTTDALSLRCAKLPATLTCWPQEDSGGTAFAWNPEAVCVTFEMTPEGAYEWFYLPLGGNPDGGEGHLQDGFPAGFVERFREFMVVWRASHGS